MVQTKRNQEKVVVTKICFYGSAKTELKIKVCKQRFCCQDDQNEGKQLYANFKTAHFVKYRSSMVTDIYETSINGILLMR